MRLTKAQARENRDRIVHTASSLFRQGGFDRTPVADLMAKAGFTHGGFYNHFTSKAALLAEASSHGFSRTAAAIESAGTAEFLRQYLSRAHRDARDEGCTLAALGGDAARHPEVGPAFEEGIESLLTQLERGLPHNDSTSDHNRRENAINALAHAVGAVVLSRACPDDAALADEILRTCRVDVLARVDHPHDH
ncbi:MAG: TetR/AcrR family transcriptional regulator [Comamonadaceae bacterium]|nr:MAG: TetR/AcrR family transcriptional regulator [Comamonadaceae bacterium]